MENNMEITREFVENLYQELNNRIVTVRFTKADGLEREMNCTLQEIIVPGEQGIPADILENAIDSQVVVVWDTDLSAWRSFRLDRLLHVN
jgi:hypothetical protein